MSRSENRHEQKKAKERAIKKMMIWTREKDISSLKKLYENFERSLGHTANTRTLCSCEMCRARRTVNKKRDELVNKSKEKDDEN